MKHLWLLLLFGFCCFSQAILCESPSETGTLIITYHAGPASERLNRIRFWLVNDRGERRLYPHGGAFVDDGDRSARMVLVENLPKGDYELEFLVPNKDSYFENVPKKTVTVPSGSVVKIDQSIKPKIIPQLETQEIAAADVDINSVDLLYNRKYGTINIEASIPSGEELSLLIEGNSEKSPIHAKAVASNGTLSWASGSLPSGTYRVTITPPDYYHPLDPFTVEVKKGQNTVIRPQLEGLRWIKVTSNIPEAIYLLRNLNGNEAWKGQGKEYTFKGLIPGTYTLTFASTNPQKANPPENRRIILSRYGDNTTVVADYDIAGELEIESNLDRYNVKIDPVNKQGKPLREVVRNYKKTIYLPSGEYRVSFLPTKNMHQLEVPKPIQVNVQAYSTAEAYGEYPGLDERIINDLENDGMLPKLQNEKRVIPANPTETMMKVVAGDMILGDPFHDNKSNELQPRKVYLDTFEINSYEVTNKQFADWLTEASKNGSIRYHENGTNNGLVTDLAGKILFQTNTANQLSQIFATKRSNESVDFSPLPGKDEHPVIFVTWHGADRFCKDLGCRLPTEAEWEKAAGMAITSAKQPLKKYRYGFSRNTIGRPWANYKINERPIESFKVKTTPVGFYNGTNFLPLEMGDTEQVRTHHAQSPTGLYDMSGNVWEWTNDWYANASEVPNQEKNPQGPSIGTKKVVKGGCYDSLESGVRVAERLGAPPDYCDEFTGFRVAR